MNRARTIAALPPPRGSAPRTVDGAVLSVRSQTFRVPDLDHPLSRSALAWAGHLSTEEADAIGRRVRWYSKRLPLRMLLTVCFRRPHLGPYPSTSWAGWSSTPVCSGGDKAGRSR